MKILGLLVTVVVLAVVPSAFASPQAQIAKKCKAGSGVRYKHNNYSKPYCKKIVKSAKTDTATLDLQGNCSANGTVKTYHGEYSLTASAQTRSNGKIETFPLTTTSDKPKTKWTVYALFEPSYSKLKGPTYEMRFIVEGKTTNWVTCVTAPAM